MDPNFSDGIYNYCFQKTKIIQRFSVDSKAIRMFSSRASIAVSAKRKFEQDHSLIANFLLFLVTYENRNESIVGNTPNKPRHKWQEDFLGYNTDTLSWQNYHDGMGAYSFKYKFDEALVAEFGKLNADNTVSFVNGFMAFGGLRLNYTANATACNVSLCMSFDFEFLFIFF